MPPITPSTLSFPETFLAYLQRDQNGKEESRLAYLFNRFIDCNNYLKIDDLCDELYLSRTQLKQSLKELREYLHDFDLTIATKAYYGMYLEGDEINKRRAIAHFEEYQMDFDILQRIRDIVISSIANADYVISDDVLDNLVAHLYIAYYRVMKKEYANIDSRVKVLHLDEAGLSIARNAGIEIATAPYIGFIDSDDYIEPTMYENMLSAMLQNKVYMVYCNFCFEYEDGRIEQMYPNTDNVYVRTSQDVQRDIIFEKVSSSACTKLFDKIFFDSYRFPIGMFFEDHATIYRWISICDKIVWIDAAYYHYIQRGDSICHTINSIKRYHYFLAEYSRLEFAKERRLFEGRDWCDAVNVIVENCFNHFQEFMTDPNHQLYPVEIKDMRNKLSRWRFLSRKELSSKYYKRLRKITYFWSIYYWTHFAKKKN